MIQKRGLRGQKGQLPSYFLPPRRALTLLHQKITANLPEGHYDPYDLERQVLYRITTYNPKKIKECLVKNTIAEQFAITQQRLSMFPYDLKYVFRGRYGKFLDLCEERRLALFEENGHIYGRGKYISFEVILKRIEDDGIISLFTNDLHINLKQVPEREVFGLFFVSDPIPWALIVVGVGENIQEHFYTLPGAPENTHEILSSSVQKYLKFKKGDVNIHEPHAEKMASCDLSIKYKYVFVPEIIKGKKCFRHNTRPVVKNKESYIVTHPDFPLSFLRLLYKCFQSQNYSKYEGIETTVGQRRKCVDKIRRN